MEEKVHEKGDMLEVMVSKWGEIFQEKCVLSPAVVNTNLLKTLILEIQNFYKNCSKKLKYCKQL